MQNLPIWPEPNSEFLAETHLRSDQINPCLFFRTYRLLPQLGLIFTLPPFISCISFPPQAHGYGWVVVDLSSKPKNNTSKPRQKIAHCPPRQWLVGCHSNGSSEKNPSPAQPNPTGWYTMQGQPINQSRTCIAIIPSRFGGPAAASLAVSERASERTIHPSIYPSI